MDLNSGDFEDVKTFVRTEFNLDTLCQDGEIFDVCVLENNNHEQEILKVDYSPTIIQNTSEDLHIEDELQYIPSVPKKLKTNGSTLTPSSTHPTKSIKTGPYILPTIPPFSPNQPTTSFEEIAQVFVPITQDGRVMKEVMKQGVGVEVGAKANITAHYNAYLEFADEPFDSTKLRSAPLNCDIGSQSLIEGLEIAIGTMKKKEISRFLISADYAYGSRGCPPRIPANSTCLYVVELLDFSRLDEHACGYFNLPMSARKHCAFDTMMQAIETVINKSRGHYKRDDFNQATKSYAQALNMLDNHMLKDEEEEVKLKRILHKVLVDLALSWLRFGHPYRTLHYCSRLLSLNHRHSKGLYLKGKALRQIGEFGRAKTSLQKANKERPGCKEIMEELETVTKQIERVKICIGDGGDGGDGGDKDMDTKTTPLNIT